MQYIVDENGRKKSVVLLMNEYQELLQDMKDLAVIAERKDEPTEPLELVANRLEDKW